MGLTAFKQEFEGFAAELPTSPNLVARPLINDPNPMSDFNEALKLYQRQVSIWYSNLLISLEKLKSLFDKASEDETGKSTNFLIDEAIPQVLGRLDQIAKSLQTNIDIVPTLAISDLAKEIGKRGQTAMSVQLELVYDVKSKIDSIVEEYHPDNKPVGDVLKSIDDFDAWFDRIAAL
ncbi:hypothetical protein LJR231_004067 [Phyllobacterium sp. LjRoot231]|uniref:hypothetical protein n=1 Tax=Phyllobacterium sp. LjRoot231 TaxID=3342289 RepID=UPI003ECE22AE